MSRLILNDGLAEEQGHNIGYRASIDLCPTCTFCLYKSVSLRSAYFWLSVSIIVFGIVYRFSGTISIKNDCDDSKAARNLS